MEGHESAQPDEPPQGAHSVQPAFVSELGAGPQPSSQLAQRDGHWPMPFPRSMHVHARPPATGVDG
jgi:hypothetical protein